LNFEILEVSTGNLTFDKIILQNAEIKASLDALHKKFEKFEKIISNEIKQTKNEENSKEFINVHTLSIFFVL
jgi:hypothetical protein